KKALECMPTVDINYGGWDTLWHMSFIMKDLKVGYVPLPLYYARRHEGRLSNAKKDPTKQEHRKEEQIKIRKYLEKLGVGLERPGKN
ncbi:MAG: hypothetical protein KDH96_05990, partial [Candidatus Riesia sp.]|nr:hypothetical protein [Candidatus Riesia sp.]